MPHQSYIYYKNKINAGETPATVIAEARTDYALTTDYAYNIEYQGANIPFNLDREHIICLIENRKYSEARDFIENMRRTYRTHEHWNFIEIFEYHLRASIHAEKSVELAISEAKKEFNQHTITIVTVVVGVITLLGTANQAFTVDNFAQGIKTFWSITAAILLIIIFAFALNNGTKR